MYVVGLGGRQFGSLFAMNSTVNERSGTLCGQITRDITIYQSLEGFFWWAFSGFWAQLCSGVLGGLWVRLLGLCPRKLLCTEPHGAHTIGYTLRISALDIKLSCHSSNSASWFPWLCVLASHLRRFRL